MQTRKLGDSDLNLTPIGFGTWAIGGGEWGMGWGPQEEKDSIEYKLKLVKESLDRDSGILATSEDRLSQVIFKIKNQTEVLESIKNDDFQSLRLKLK